MNRQRAGAVAVLAQSYVKEGKIETAAEHMPDYLRLSQAERERLEKEKGLAACLLGMRHWYFQADRRRGGFARWRR